MIRDIQIEQIPAWPFSNVILNGKSGLVIDSDANSPTGNSGSVRRTFLFDDYVVKIGGIGESRVEIEPEDSPFFAKVVLVDINMGWLVQERVNCVPNQEVTDLDWCHVLEMVQKYDIGDVCYRRRDMDWEKSAHNWTVDASGQPVIFDYDYNSHTFNGFESWQFRSGDEDEHCSCSDCREEYISSLLPDEYTGDE